MKIYRFNPATGAYLGEDFADETPLKNRDRMLSDDATTIPPPRVERGLVPFFNASEQRWTVACAIAAAHKGLWCDELNKTTETEDSP